MKKSVGFARALWQAFFWFNVCVILFYWWHGSSHILLGGGMPGVLIALGRISGLVAGFAVLQQFFFMGRNPWLEKVFGLDKLSRIHQVSGKWALGFIVLHPILLTFGYSALRGVNLIEQFISFLTSYEDVLQAFIGLTLFLIVVGMSLVIVRKHFRYESWYFVHLSVYLAIFFTYGHQFANGTDLQSSKFFYGYWVVLYGIVFTSHIVFRFLRPVYKFVTHRFIVDEVVRENYNTVSVYLSGKHLENFKIYPGQFMIFRFLTSGMWWQAHPFSLSRPSDGKRLRITVKELGDFTNGVKNLKQGTSVIIDGPYGVFTDFFSISSNVLMIAGGIGITPIRSLMEDMLAKGKKVTLLFANRTRKDIVFTSEFQQLKERYGVDIRNVLSDDPTFPSEHGFVDSEKILSAAPDVVKRDVYLCGPPPMMNAVIKTLQGLGVPMRQIHFERFSLR